MTFALPDNVEELILIGDAAVDATGNNTENYLGGNNADNVLRGLAGDDTLYGWSGNDRLDGGAGADWMDGGTGDDVYIVDDAGDRVIENADAGNDTVLSSIDYTLGNHVENLVLTGDATINDTGSDADNLLVGNDAANVLMGLAGNDSLFGRGGNDVLDGGAGNDTYYITVNDGIDNLIDIDGDDTLVFGNCITPERVAVRYVTDSQGRAIASLRLLDADGCESETEGVEIVLNADGSLPIEHVRFPDGTETTLGALVVRSLTHVGTDKSDRIITGCDDDTVYALGGNDLIDAGSGHDVLYGGKGKDVLYGRSGLAGLVTISFCSVPARTRSTSDSATVGIRSGRWIQAAMIARRKTMTLKTKFILAKALPSSICGLIVVAMIRLSGFWAPRTV